MTDTEATPKKTVTPEQKAQRQANRMLARAMAKLNHEGTREEFAAKWEAEKAKHLADAKKLTKALGREGITLAVGPKPERKGKKAEA